MDKFNETYSLILSLEKYVLDKLHPQNLCYASFLGPMEFHGTHFVILQKIFIINYCNHHYQQKIHVYFV